MNQFTPTLKRPSARGFTLIEAMIVVAIAAILGAIALPSYLEHMRRGRIGEATTNLQDMRTQVERFFQDQRTYVGMPCAATGATDYFGFACVSDATTYTITATGNAAMASFAYTINQTNTRRTTSLPAGWLGASGSSTCWVRRKDGSC